MNLDVVGEAPTATYRSNIVESPRLTDPTPVQLRGSTEDQVSSDDRIVEISPPTPRGQVPNAMNLDAVRARVRQVADELEPLRESLHLDGAIMVRVFFDRNSGRMVLDTANREATTVEETGTDEEREGVSETGRKHLAHEFTIRLRNGPDGLQYAAAVLPGTSPPSGRR